MMKGISLLAAASTAFAHTIFVQLEAGGTVYPVSHGVRTPTYDGPITDVTSNDLACNGGPNPTKSTSEIITVQAGSTVKAHWRHTLTADKSNVMDASHKGPTLAYLKKVDNALTDKGPGGGWFKIQEAGYSNGQWGTSTVITNGGEHFMYVGYIPASSPFTSWWKHEERLTMYVPAIFPRVSPRDSTSSGPR